MKIRTSTLVALAALTILCATIAKADPPLCLVPYNPDGASTIGYATATTALCTQYQKPGDATKTLMTFTCGGPYTIVLLLDQKNEAAPVQPGVLQFKLKASDSLSLNESSEDRCDARAPGWNWKLGDPKANLYFDDAAAGGIDPATGKTDLEKCPTVAGGKIISAGLQTSAVPAWSSPHPENALYKFTFDGSISTLAEGATATFDFNAAPYMTDFDLNDITLVPMNSEITCKAASYIVKVPSGSVTAGGGTPTCAGDPPAGTSTGITVSFTKPTQCVLNGSDVACPATCTPGVRVEMVTPTPGIVSNYQTGSSVTDSTARTTGTAVKYKVTGICTNGSGGAGSGAAESAAVESNSYTPACGETPTITASTVTINGVSLESITDTNCGSLQIMEGSAAVISGTIVDGDSDKTKEKVTLAYGNSDSDPAFPGDTAVTANPTTAGVFSISVPGDAVKAETDLYIAVWATDETMTSVGAAYPSTYKGGVSTAKMIPGICIKKGSALEFAEKPYPNQMPFRSAGQILHIGFKTNEQANVTMRIYSPDGNLVRQIENSSSDPFTTTGINSCKWDTGCSWDGTNYLGGSNYVANGMYIVNFYAIGTGSNFAGQIIDYTKGIVVMK